MGTFAIMFIIGNVLIILKFKKYIILNKGLYHFLQLLTQVQM